MRRLVVGVIALMMFATLVLPVPVAAQEEETAYFRVGHFSPGAGDVDVYLDGEQGDFKALSFGRLTDWVTIPPGSYRLVVVPTGEDPEAALISATLTLEAGQWVTDLLIGEVPRGTLALYPLVEDYSDIAPGETRITFFHAVPDLDAINIQLDNGILLVDALRYPALQDSGDFTEGTYGSATLDIIAGTRTIDVISALDGETVLLTMPDVTFASGKNHLVVVAGLRANAIVTWVATATDTLTMASETDLGEVNVGTGGAQVRLAYFVPDGAEAVDLYINGALSEVTKLDYGTASEWFELPADFYDLAIAPAGTSIEEAFVRAEDVPVITDQPTTLVTMGSFIADTTTIQPVVENLSPVAEGEARLAVLHTVRTLPQINVQLADGTTLLAGIGYPGLVGFSGYGSVDLRAGVRDLQIVSMLEPTDVLVDLPATQLIAGTNNLLVLAGSSYNPTAFHLISTQE